MLSDNYNLDFLFFFCWGYRACFLGTLAYTFGCPKHSLEFILEHSLNLCSCSLFYTNRGTPTFTSGPSTLNWRIPRDSHRKKCKENPGPVLRKLWHIETTPYKKFIANLRKWKKLTRVLGFPTSTVKLKSYRDKTQMPFVGEAYIAFFPTWSLHFQIADTCTHCVPIFV